MIIALILKTAGLSQREAARRLGVSAPTVHEACNTPSPGATVIARYADMAGVVVSYSETEWTYKMRSSTEMAL